LLLLLPLLLVLLLLLAAAAATATFVMSPPIACSGDQLSLSLSAVTAGVVVVGSAV
jgi:hypothetical protein